MRFNPHSELEGQHAVLSASSNHWLGYDDDKMRTVFRNRLAAYYGTRKHEFAKMAIELGQKAAKTEQTLNMYINDAIGLRMTPEVVLFYSVNAFGTADAISFQPSRENPKRYILRIHDLKTGVNPASFRQLMVYAALFCLEYNYKPHEIDIELRIYQNDVRLIDDEVDPNEVADIMARIVHLDNLITEIRSEATL